MLNRGESPVQDVLQMPAEEVIEKCIIMKPQQVLHYEFNASAPLKFNLHYHLENKTVFHVKEITEKRNEIFHPVTEQTVYCLEWRNLTDQEVRLQYRYQILRDNKEQGR